MRCKPTFSSFIRLVLAVVFTAGLGIAATPAHAGGGTTLYVSPTGGNTDCSQANPCAFGAAEAKIANDSFTIEMEAGTYQMTGFQITTGLTINGPQVPVGSPPLAIIDGENASRVLLVHAPGKTVNLQYLTFQHGLVQSDSGGGIRCGSGTLSLTQVYVRDNEIKSNIQQGENFQGGGIANTGCTLSIQNSLISGNRSNAWGGGIALTGGSNTISNSLIQDNHADETYGGGGLIVSGGTTFLNQVTISGNTAVAAGGLFVNAATGSFQMTASTVSGNHAKFSGGGLVLYNSAVITNSTISGNLADQAGGAVYLSGTGPGYSDQGKLTLTNVTLANNSAVVAGDGVYFSTGGTTLNPTNSILAGSGGATCAGPNITINSGGHNIVADASCPLTPAMLSDKTNTDPRLAPLQANGGPTQTQALLYGSPAINTGNNAFCPPMDQRGFHRVGACDIGAYETGLWWVLLPLVRR